ncbi:chromate transporter [Lacticaseibacillus hulanensis]|uniref:chromate transporter n=1 Tax=Lacticaseibacillus hulanensis TaxID=2493111 RepID=UPI000FD936C6|nr:chromate transporter [Lacticaseibacillus hulanensis]
MRKNWLLFKIYLLAGTLTFSGGMAMLPTIERVVVNKYHLMSRADLYEYSTLSQTLPGVIALTNACFIGKKVNGRSGMIFAGLGAVLPAFVLMSLATTAYQLVPKEGIALSILGAIRAASAAFLFSAAYSLARYNLSDKLSVLLALGCFLLTVLSVASAPTLIIGAAVVGITSTFVKRQRDQKKG